MMILNMVMSVRHDALPLYAVARCAVASEHPFIAAVSLPVFASVIGIKRGIAPH